MNRSELYQDHLDRVSRSFAFCIRELREPFRHRVALAYLLCRTLDTLEDTKYETLGAKLAQMDHFESFIASPPGASSMKRWLHGLSPHVKPEELSLLDDAPVFFEDLHALPPEQRAILQELVLSMSNGMRHFLAKSGSDGGLILESVAEVNRYCFFVAGIVGEMLTRLLVCFNGSFTVDGRKLLQAHHFGLFLQKINLLKDRFEDEKEGRFLIPSHTGVWRSLEADANEAIRYLVELPSDEPGYRTFCAWSLFLGLASIPWIKRSWAAGALNKIPRAATQKLLAEVKRIACDNEALLELFNKMKPRAKASPLLPGADFSDFSRLYQGRLPYELLPRLGV